MRIEPRRLRFICHIFWIFSIATHKPCIMDKKLVVRCKICASNDTGMNHLQHNDIKQTGILSDLMILAL